MNMITKYTKHLEDNDIIGPKDLFGVFHNTEKARSLIETTEQNLINHKFTELPSYGS